MKYIAKPHLTNKTGLKEFDNPVDALTYLNHFLAPKNGDHQDYVFIAPSTSKRNLKRINNPDDIMALPYSIVATRQRFNIFAGNY